MLTETERVLGYVGGSVLIVFTAFGLGTAHFESTECSGPDFDGECDVAALEGMVRAVAAIIVVVVAVVILEVVRLRRRRAGSTK